MFYHEVHVMPVKSPVHALDITDDTSPWLITDAEAFDSGSPVANIGAGSALKMALYLTETGDTAAVNINDIHQGQIGDCFLLSSIGEIARTHPDFIQKMIHANADGSETVQLYVGRNGFLPSPGATTYKPVAVTVSNVFPTYAANNGATQDVVGSQKEIWVQVVEKAVSALGGGYSSIANGGNPTVAMEELTGHAASYMSAGSVTADMLKSFSAAGSLVTFDTPNRSNLPFNLVGNHAYMFEGLVSTGGSMSVALGNPWGYHQPMLIPVSQIGKTFAEVDVGRIA
ncbi:MAG: hypothetical protein NVSMB18_08980 [Acetobacteraceae bacterium]